MDLIQIIASRDTIAKNALNVNTTFGAGPKLNWSGFRNDPQAFVDWIDVEQTLVACQALAEGSQAA
jgi:hypothetical protein